MKCERCGKTIKGNVKYTDLESYEDGVTVCSDCYDDEVTQCSEANYHAYDYDYDEDIRKMFV